jgi:fructokinase
MSAPACRPGTIDASDAFIGAFPAHRLAARLGRTALDRLDAVQRAATLACRVAALTCARASADPPRLAELQPRRG